MHSAVVMYHLPVKIVLLISFSKKNQNLQFLVIAHFPHAIDINK